ncbi:hypothetical protein KFL_001040220 [Klebsormidium nitens]|uniref:WW domain-containing protein n=1 Tax=Klebsormidium nitens TaxID=105231 RepID=A0A1Y1HYF9_KLENI|nr:hypothetical protein KFL_001040220 [Klebsormidium nitens]|eukprot:GAQ82219.1 hypothetical protein KFL_001040220 [Klebsormidium nitens]
MEPCIVQNSQAMQGNEADEQKQQQGQPLPSVCVAPVNQATSPTTFPTTKEGAVSAVPANSKRSEPQAMVVSQPGQGKGPVKAKATRKRQRKTLALPALKPAPLMPLWIQRPLQPGWISAFDPATRLAYYFHPSTGRSQWEPPLQPQQPLPPPWIEAVDPSRGLPYYYNPATGASQWECPVALYPPLGGLALPWAGVPSAASPVVAPTVPTSTLPARLHQNGVLGQTATELPIGPTASMVPALPAGASKPSSTPTIAATSAAKPSSTPTTAATSAAKPASPQPAPLSASADIKSDNKTSCAEVAAVPAVKLASTETVLNSEAGGQVEKTAKAPGATAQPKAAKKTTKKAKKAGEQSLVRSVANLPLPCVECGCLGPVTSEGVCFKCSTNPSNSTPAVAVTSPAAQTPPQNAPSQPPAKRAKKSTQKRAKPPLYTPPPPRASETDSDDTPSDVHLPEELLEMVVKLVAAAKPRTESEREDCWSYTGYFARHDRDFELRVDERLTVRDLANLSAVSKDWKRGVEAVGWATLRAGITDTCDFVRSADESAVDMLKEMQKEGATIVATRAAAEYKVKPKELAAQVKQYKVKRNPHRRSGKMRIYYVKDVLKVALAKHGGACGLRQKIGKCEAAARKRAASCAGKPGRMRGHKRRPWPSWDCDDDDYFSWDL